MASKKSFDVNTFNRVFWKGAFSDLLECKMIRDATAKRKGSRRMGVPIDPSVRDSIEKHRSGNAHQTSRTLCKSMVVEILYTFSFTDLLEKYLSDVECLRDEMDEWCNNLQTHFASTSKADEVSEAVDQLDAVTENLEDFFSLLSPELLARKLEFPELLGSQEWKTATRSHRALLCSRVISAMLNRFPDDDSRLIGDWISLSKDQYDQLRTILEARSLLSNARDELDGTSFPGMF